MTDHRLRDESISRCAEQFLSGDAGMTAFCPERPDASDDFTGQLKDLTILRAEAAERESWPLLTADGYAEYSRNGNRVNYETPYFKRRHMLNELVTAECLEGRGRFLAKIYEGVELLLEEPGWQLPAHNAYKRGEPARSVPDPERPVLDLFACETGAQLAMIMYLLQNAGGLRTEGSRLSEHTPATDEYRSQADTLHPGERRQQQADMCHRGKSLSKRVVCELDRRILKPYIHEHFWWMGEGDEPMCNWTPWCTQNVLLTAFLPIYDDVRTSTAGGTPVSPDRSVILKKAAYSLDCFLKDYAEDGCCDEGPHYFRHAGLCLDGCLMVMNEVTHGAFSQIYRLPKIRNMAAYIYNVHACGDYYFNFSDSAAVIPKAGVREYLFGAHTQQPDIMQWAAESLKEAVSEGRAFDDESVLLNLCYRCLTLTLTKDILTNAPASIEAAASGDSLQTHIPGHMHGTLQRSAVWYPGCGLLTAHSASFDLAVKAGTNGDNHNHNDVGSFILYRCGRPVFVDIGVENYTAKTFSAARYSIWTMQSCYHNLPTINGCDERDGSDYAAQDVTVDILGSEVHIAMELAGAYGLAERGISYIREIWLDTAGDRFILKDRTNATEAVMHLICYDRDIFEQGYGHHLPADMHTEELPITDERLKASWDKSLYRISVDIEAGNFELYVEGIKHK